MKYHMNDDTQTLHLSYGHLCRKYTHTQTERLKTRKQSITNFTLP